MVSLHRSGQLLSYAGKSRTSTQFDALVPSDVCGLRYRPGRCSRAVVEDLGRLLLSKLAYASFLLPAAALVLHTPVWRRTKEAVVRCFKPTYMAAYAVDSEFTAILM